tara:strand:- start:6134 stop:6742 length:609 start_codon:yes stop_codon:yes gene_type:complete
LNKNKSSKNWIRKQHRDPFFKKSKLEGYRSRSAFKLIEMDEKFKFLNKNTNLLDLGSSPGGWSQVVSKKVTKGKILAVDTKPMEKVNNVNFLQKDMNDEFIFEKINFYFQKKIDVVLSDMAVNTSGNKDIDSYNTGKLCLIGMEISKKILNPNGVFVSKLFMGPVFREIQEKAQKYFKKVVKFKPEASRQESREIYIYCKGL